MVSRQILKSFASSLAPEVSSSPASKVLCSPRWIRKNSILELGLSVENKRGAHRNLSHIQGGHLLASLATFGASSARLLSRPLSCSKSGQLLRCTQDKQQRRGASSTSGVEQDNKEQALPVKEIKRIEWRLEENALGKRFSWVLRMFGFYSSDAKMLRSSAKLYLIARTQASRKEVRPRITASSQIFDCWLYLDLAASSPACH
jgi:hypothetical protein